MKVFLFFPGGFTAFRARYPEWCESDSADAAAPLMGLRSLRISSGSSSASSSSCGGSSDAEDSAAERCDSSLGLDEDREFPVEIVPFLFLGNAANSEDSEALQRHHIQVRFRLFGYGENLSHILIDVSPHLVATPTSELQRNDSSLFCIMVGKRAISFNQANME
jgi:hypothetical protein